MPEKSQWYRAKCAEIRAAVGHFADSESKRELLLWPDFMNLWP